MAEVEDVISFLGSCGDNVNSERERALKIKEKTDPNSFTPLIQNTNIDVAIPDCKLEIYFLFFSLASVAMLCKNGLGLLKRKKRTEEMQKRRRTRTLAELFGFGKQQFSHIEGTCSNIEGKIEEKVQSDLLSFQETTGIDLTQRESEDESDSDICVLAFACDEDSEMSPLTKSLETHTESVKEVEIQFNNGVYESFEILGPDSEIQSLQLDNDNIQVSTENIFSLPSEEEDDVRILHSDKTDT